MAASSIFAGTVAASCFGVADYVAARAGREEGWRSTLLGAQVSSLPLLLAAAVVFEPPLVEGAERRGALLVAASLGVVHLLGSVSLYRALQVGVVSVVSPIAGTFGVVTAAIAVGFGHPMSAGLAAALLLASLGGILASREPARQTDERRTTGRGRARWIAGAGWALASSLALGSSFFGLEWLEREGLGVLWAVAIYRGVCGAGLGVTALGRPPGAWERPARERPARKRPARERPARGWGARCVRWSALGILDAGGMVAYGLGCRHGDVAVVAVVASVFPAVTVGLAQWRMRERLSRWQWAGLVALFGGLVAVASTGR